ncbi:MAG: enoyl-CoA hydratase/isomerase family protein [Thermomicrobiales bacterium]
MKGETAVVQEKQESGTVVSDPSQEILFAVEDQVATITFNRPEAMNAMTWNMYDRLVAYCDELDQNDDIRVAILKGAGDRAFVSGTDISQFQAFATPQDAIDYERRTGEVTDRLERVRKPTIAMIHGVCVGGGAGIALACDFRYADPELRFGIPIARTIGNCLSLKGYSRLLDFVGPAKTKELIMLAKLLTAEEALGLGVMTEIVPADELEARVQEVAGRLKRLAPLTLAATKESIRRLQAARSLDSAQGEDLILSCYMSDDFREAVRAFVEKRKHVWTGR